MPHVNVFLHFQECISDFHHIEVTLCFQSSFSEGLQRMRMYHSASKVQVGKLFCKSSGEQLDSSPTTFTPSHSKYTLKYDSKF